MTEGEGKLTIREEEYEYVNEFINDWEKAYKSPSDHYDNYFIKDNNNNYSYFSMFTSFLNYFNPFAYKNENENKVIYNNSNSNLNKKIIFVVSVLKDEFYWSKKYIRYDDNKNKLLDEGILNNHIIGIDKNGFGWIVEKENKKCKGQIIEVDKDDFIDIEYFYGLDDEKMKEINIQLNEKEIKAFAFILKNIPKELINEKGIIEVEEYDLDMQNKYFNPMQHIINQQEKYLNMSLDFNVEDRW